MSVMILKFIMSVTASGEKMMGIAGYGGVNKGCDVTSLVKPNIQLHEKGFFFKSRNILGDH